MSCSAYDTLTIWLSRSPTMVSLLSVCPQVGSAIKYTMAVEFRANGGIGKIRPPRFLRKFPTLTRTVITYSVQQTQIDAKGSYGGETFDVPARTPITMTYAPNRLLTKIKGDLITTRILTGPKNPGDTDRPW